MMVKLKAGNDKYNFTALSVSTLQDVDLYGTLQSEPAEGNHRFQLQWPILYFTFVAMVPAIGLLCGNGLLNRRI